MYRAQQRAPGRVRPMLVYHAKRLEFALGFLGALEAVALAEQAREKGNRKMRIEPLEKAIESIYNGLEAYGEVASDPGDRAAIAVLNTGYRTLKADLERLEKEKDR